MGASLRRSTRESTADNTNSNRIRPSNVDENHVGLDYAAEAEKEISALQSRGDVAELCSHYGQHSFRIVATEPSNLGLRWNINRIGHVLSGVEHGMRLGPIHADCPFKSSWSVGLCWRLQLGSSKKARKIELILRLDSFKRKISAASELAAGDPSAAFDENHRKGINAFVTVSFASTCPNVENTCRNYLHFFEPRAAIQFELPDTDQLTADPSACMSLFVVVQILEESNVDEFLKHIKEQQQNLLAITDGHSQPYRVKVDSVKSLTFYVDDKHIKIPPFRYMDKSQKTSVPDFRLSMGSFVTDIQADFKRPEEADSRASSFLDIASAVGKKIVGFGNSRSVSADHTGEDAALPHLQSLWQ